MNFHKGHSTNAENSELQARRTDRTNPEEDWGSVKCQAVYSFASLSILRKKTHLTCKHEEKHSGNYYYCDSRKSLAKKNTHTPTSKYTCGLSCKARMTK